MRNVPASSPVYAPRCSLSTPHVPCDLNTPQPAQIPLNPSSVSDLRRTQTAITSNIALSDWGRYLGDVTLTAAILDRIAMHAIRIDIDGPSYRQYLAKSRAAEPSAKT
jgi:hypothetical protein